MVEYLERYSEDSVVGVLVANAPARKIYPVTELSCITDLEYPVFFIEVGASQNMNEEMIEACEEDERTVSLVLKRDGK